MLDPGRSVFFFFPDVLFQLWLFSVDNNTSLTVARNTQLVIIAKNRLCVESKFYFSVLTEYLDVGTGGM